jgi:hypothetical protein
MISISKPCGTNFERKNVQFPSAENCDFYGLFLSKQYSFIFQTHARCPMEKSKGHWTFHLSNGPGNVHWNFVCPLDPMDKWNFHRTFAFSVGQLPCI